MPYKAFIIKLIRSNTQKYTMFLISAIFSMTIFFVFVNLWYTDGFKDNINGQMQTLMIIAATITILFSVFIISYVQWHLMRERAKSFSVLLSYGMTPKDLCMLIIYETFFIYVISLAVAFITGSVFSKLFYMISVKLLTIDSLAYQLTKECFIITSIAFAIIFSVILIISLVIISLKDITELGKVKRNVELTKKGNALAGILGLFLIVGSVIALYLHNLHSTNNLSRWILTLGFLSIIGIYLFISHISRIIYGAFKKNSSLYYKHILEASEFSMEYRQNRKTLFVLTLLTYGILLFTGVTYTLHSETYRLTAVENPHDLYLHQVDVMDLLDETDISNILQTSDVSINEKNILPYLYMKAPNIKTNSWRSSEWITVISETALISCFQELSYVDVRQGEAIQIIFESDIDKDFVFFDEDIKLENEIHSFTLKSRDIIYDKILNRYVFTQALLIVVDDFDYSIFHNDATEKEKGTLYMYQFEDWKKSNDVIARIGDSYYDKFDKYSKDNTAVIKELTGRYGYAFLQVRSKYSFWSTQRMQGSYSLFIMGFVSILFGFCILVTYFFKVFMSFEDDIKRFKKLDGIGMLLHEKDKLIRVRIRLLLFVPTLLGIVLISGWSYALNFKKILEIDLSSLTLLRNTLVIGGIYLLIITIYYISLKQSYMKRISIT